MESILHLFSETRLTISFLTAVVSVIYVITATYLLKWYRTRNHERDLKKKIQFFAALNDGLKNGTIRTLDDVVNVYKGVEDLSAEDLAFRMNLSKLLREYLVSIVSERANRVAFFLRQHEKPDDAKSVDAERLKQKDLITQFIAVNDKTSPYADLPAVERSIISDISTYALAKNFEGILRKLNELASAIQVREDSVARVQATNRWSVPLAVIGLLLTVLFGIISLL